MGGIKTNISLFLRILGDADFQAGKLDTGFLDRLLSKTNPAIATLEAKPESGALEAIAAIATGMFAVLDPISPASRNGGSGGASSVAPATVSSNWKKQGRSEGLR